MERCRSYSAAAPLNHRFVPFSAPGGHSAPVKPSHNIKSRMSAIQITNVEKRYKSLQALGGVSLTIEEGEFFGLLGPNGAGKTTLISIIAGLIRPDAGTVTIHGHDVTGDFREARRKLGVVPQELVFDPFFTVRETLSLIHI